MHQELIHVWLMIRAGAALWKVSWNKKSAINLAISLASDVVNLDWVKTEGGLGN